MSRGARFAVGLTTAGVLLVVSLVALVTGAVLAAASPFGFGVYDDSFYGGSDFSGRADAEVLDVDDEFGWIWVDVRYYVGDEVVVTGVDWNGGDPPEVGDTLELAYDPSDPEYGVAVAADVEGPLVDIHDDSVAELTTEGTPAGAVTAFWVAGVSGGVSLLAVPLTVLWASRAPRRPATTYASPYLPTGYPPTGPPGYPPQHPAQPYRPPPPGPTGWGAPSG